MQPVVIQNMGNKKAYSGNGLLERFLFVLPKSNLGFRTHDTPPVPTRIREAYEKQIESLLDIQGSGIKGQRQSKVLSLADDTLAEWRQFQLAVEAELRPDGRLSSCQGWGGKISGFALRIAGLLHLAEHHLDNHIISANTMRSALQIAALLKDHALAAFGLMGIDQSTADAKEIWRWVETQGKGSFTRTDLTSSMRHKKFGKAERLNKALDVLIERNLVSQPRKRPTRKPTLVYHVNPKLLKPNC
jgi:hypothetical protein